MAVMKTKRGDSFIIFRDIKCLTHLLPFLEVGPGNTEGTGSEVGMGLSGQISL